MSSVFLVVQCLLTHHEILIILLTSMIRIILTLSNEVHWIILIQIALFIDIHFYYTISFLRGLFVYQFLGPILARKCTDLESLLIVVILMQTFKLKQNQARDRSIAVLKILNDLAHIRKPLALNRFRLRRKDLGRHIIKFNEVLRHIVVHHHLIRISLQDLWRLKGVLKNLASSFHRLFIHEGTRDFVFQYFSILINQILVAFDPILVQVWMEYSEYRLFYLWILFYGIIDPFVHVNYLIFNGYGIIQAFLLLRLLVKDIHFLFLDLEYFSWSLIDLLLNLIRFIRSRQLTGPSRVERRQSIFQTLSNSSLTKQFMTRTFKIKLINNIIRVDWLILKLWINDWIR